VDLLAWIGEEAVKKIKVVGMVEVLTGVLRHFLDDSIQ